MGAMKKRLIAVLGPTASGKTALALDITGRLSGTYSFEAINADSRQVYRFMDIGTAKPTAKERAALKHHLLDIVDPDEPFSLATWLEMANEALESIWSRGAIPIVVGGTGQYVWALLEGWRVPRVPPQEELRRELEALPADELLQQLHQIDPEAHAFIQPRNVRRIVRALEVYHATGKPFSHWRTREAPRFEWLALGISIERDQLYRRIDARVDAMMKAGFLEEVRSLRDRGYDCDLPSMSSIGYREMCMYLDGTVTLEEALYRTKVGTHRLARHQMAWFKPSNRRIKWVKDVDEAVARVSEFLGNEER
jgi:tRNA dimethylallyltransferase